jgi:tRNA/tmRNA/rRNA uracil-C5-methylase (TrmA/RlmC/RlmD family)
LFDDVGGHEFGLELADGATCVHGFESAEDHVERSKQAARQGREFLIRDK